jgi:hypothetical protein
MGVNARGSMPDESSGTAHALQHIPTIIRFHAFMPTVEGSWKAQTRDNPTREAEKEWGIEMKKFLNKLEKVTGFDIDGDGKVCTRLCFSRLHFLVWFLRCC